MHGKWMGKQVKRKKIKIKQGKLTKTVPQLT
jgi:hypothetical protein